ncbi:MAG: phosphoenolpyruvate carboxykinase (ATP) [Anaerolineae bacterium]|nr:phosphoenolpyruvate carboxykinase (ATP) [Anaerolineae bacterium]
MSNSMGSPSNYGLENHGLHDLNMVYWTLPTPALVESAISRHEGFLAHEGGLIVRTGVHTGRSAKDKFIVQDGKTDGDIWWGEINQPISPEHFDRLHQRMLSYFQGQDVFVQDTTVSAHPDYRMPVRVITAQAWHSLFTRNMFLRLPNSELANHVPEFTVMQAPEFQAKPGIEGTKSETFIVMNFEKKLVLIGGTIYSGEIKKSIFTAMNFSLPKQGVLPMHCSATVNTAGEVALFFGLSGTGKTTLSSDPERLLIGDDEHGWGDDGVFNFEGGCYAKAINLDPNLEPLIYAATRRFGTILENVGYDPVTRRVNYEDDSLTENTRASYPIGFLPNIVPEGRGGHPNHVFFLTADAFGVMPPIAKLTPEQAIYYFMSGYTAKLAGTEKGLGREPQATFSACFGAPFLPSHPKVYAELLKEKVKKHNTQVWLVNTGWTGGGYGVGKRFHLPHTRAMVRAAMQGELDGVPLKEDPVFGLLVPEQVPDAPSDILTPKSTWKDGAAYDKAAQDLVARFQKNFEQYRGHIGDEIFAAGPKA